MNLLVAVGVTPSSAPTPPGTCEAWATSDDVCAPCTVDTADLESWMQVASDLLFELSGQRFPGHCTDTVRPCAQTCHDDPPPRYDDLGASFSWSWYGSCGCRSQSCGCSTLSELTLSGWPLVSVEEVLIDGAIVDPSEYRVDDWGRLVRLRGTEDTVQHWPSCQQLDLPVTEADTFQISFTYGQRPPAAGVAAAASLGCQLALACAGSGDCRLPQRVQSITRQGVSMVLLDPFTFFDDGRTGLYDVDLFLAAYGPTSKKRWPPLVVNPDRHARVRRTTG